MHPASRLLAVLLVVSVLACAGRPSEAQDPPPRPRPPPSAGTGLRPASDLAVNCFGWPEREFSKRNRATRGQFLRAGDRAVDFELSDVTGRPVKLSALLAERPVLLVQGSYTCPVFQERLPALRDSAARYDNRVHTVVVYNIEAHPKAEPSPYRGVPTEHEYSDRGQPRTYADRATNARAIEAGRAIVAIDALADSGANPVWCTYGTCPSCAWLVRQDGVIEAMHDWYDPASMVQSIDALLSR